MSESKYACTSQTSKVPASARTMSDVWAAMSKYPLTESLGVPVLNDGLDDYVYARDLEAALAKAPVVYGFSSDNAGSFVHGECVRPSGWTHQGLIVCVRPTVPDTAESLLREWLECCDAYAAQVREGPFQEFANRARALLNKETQE